MLNFLRSPKDNSDESRRSDSPLATKQDLVQMENRIMALIDDTLADVQAQTTVVGSVATLLAGLSAQLAAAGTDPTKLAALKSQLDNNTAALSAAVVANTPSPANITPVSGGVAVSTPLVVSGAVASNANVPASGAVAGNVNGPVSSPQSNPNTTPANVNNTQTVPGVITSGPNFVPTS